MEKELWKPLTYHGEDFGDVYEISNTGKMRNKISMKERRLNLNKQGYLHCVISRGRKRKIAIKIHRAVAENFVVGNSCGLVINHKDGNKQNNNADNLEFVTTAENNLHARINGLVRDCLGCDNHMSYFSPEDIREIRKMYSSGQYKVKQIAIIFNTNLSVIYKITHYMSYTNIK